MAAVSFSRLSAVIGGQAFHVDSARGLLGCRPVNITFFAPALSSWCCLPSSWGHIAATNAGLIFLTEKPPRGGGRLMEGGGRIFSLQFFSPVLGFWGFLHRFPAENRIQQIACSPPPTQCRDGSAKFKYDRCWEGPRPPGLTAWAAWPDSMLALMFRGPFQAMQSLVYEPPVSRRMSPAYTGRNLA